MNLFRLGVLILFADYCLLLSPAVAEERYTLGAGDHLEVKVSDFRAGTGEAYQWTAFNGGTAEYIVGPSGWLSLPVVGELNVDGKTTADLEDVIATKLQAKAGLTAKPDASVQIVKFRPFYVVGGVDKPGEYDYRPGLTVLQAVGIAGGLQRVTNDALLGLMRDALASRGDLRVLVADRLALMARQARLDAEMAGKSTIDFPADLTSKSSDPNVARMLREEQMIFTARQEGVQTQVAALEQNKTYLHNEIDSLKQKNITTDKQLEATRKELSLIAGLVSKGLSVAPRQLELEQNIAQIENNQTDVQVAIVRANEDIAKTDRDIAALKTTQRNDILQEASDVRVKLAETIEKIQTSQTLVQQAEVRAPMMTVANTEAYDKPRYSLARRTNDGRSVTLAAEESDLVQPGDVVRVTPRFSDATTAATAAPAPSPAGGQTQ
ncbi:MAG: polysaccharide biosynthesis/export family protein [Ancalomicrobiaceae bacterium]|nr:polysaccharide biosynthesis/export family protein [Ancalomicrobiaceae bacterium]